MSKKNTEDINDYPKMKSWRDSIPDNNVMLSYAWVKRLTDGEFIVMCNCDLDFRCDNKTAHLIKERMIELKIAHGTEVKDNQIIMSV